VSPILLCVVGVLALLSWIGWERRSLGRSPYRKVVAGAYRSHVDPETDPVCGVVLALATRPAGAIADLELPTQRDAADQAAAPRVRSHDAAFAGTLAGLTGLADWHHVDSTVLDAIEQWTHTDVDNGLDLWRTVHERYPDTFGTEGFGIKLRGHVGEQEVFDQLSSWAGDGLSVPTASNHPGSDFTLGGHEFNVKVGGNASTIAEHLRTHPDIPVIVNADMAGLDPDALHVDLTQPFDPDLLAGHSVIVADGLLLSDIHDHIADALGPMADGYDLGDALDAASDLGVPVLGTVVRVVRSGIREQRLAEYHGDRRRAVANVASDATIIGTGVTAGGALGFGLGMALDVMTMGATAGLGTTVVGPAIGSFLGARIGGRKAAEKRRQPLTDARAASARAVQAYGYAVEASIARAELEWREDVLPAAQAQLRDVKEALDARLGLTLRAARQSLATSDADLLRESRAELESLRDVGRTRASYGLAALFRKRRWLQAAQAASARVEVTAMLDVLSAHDDGNAKVLTMLGRHARRRATVLASVAEAASRTARVAAYARATVTRDLNERRKRLEHRVKQETHQPADLVWQAASTVRLELVATGTRTPAWVQANVPAAPARPALDGA
jgi:hypothetical protein